jgi:glycosyltransferase involved in cell wall biosynthesis
MGGAPRMFFECYVCGTLQTSRTKKLHRAEEFLDHKFNAYLDNTRRTGLLKAVFEPALAAGFDLHLFSDDDGLTLHGLGIRSSIKTYTELRKADKYRSEALLSKNVHESAKGDKELLVALLPGSAISGRGVTVLEEILSAQPAVVFLEAVLYQGQSREWLQETTNDNSDKVFFSAEGLHTLANRFRYSVISGQHHFIFLRIDTSDRYTSFAQGVLNDIKSKGAAYSLPDWSKNANTRLTTYNDEAISDSGLPDLNFARMYLSGPQNQILYVDCIFFQLYSTGIAKLWADVFRVWAEKYQDRVVLICRGGPVPEFGFRKIYLPEFSFSDVQSGIRGLTWSLLREGARNLLSTYYTFSEMLPVRAVVYDMIPEELGWQGPDWDMKTRYLQLATSSHSISNTTKKKLVSRHPHLDKFSVSHFTGISNVFSPLSPNVRREVRQSLGVTSRFLFILPCALGSYKNGFAALRALASLDIASESEVFVTAGGDQSSIVQAHMPHLKIRFVRFSSDSEYARLVASSDLVLWPSTMEGMGFPPIEAVACGVPAVCLLNEINFEIFGPNAFYSKTLEPSDFAGAILHALETPIPTDLVERVSELRSYDSYAQSLFDFGINGVAA